MSSVVSRPRGGKLTCVSPKARRSSTPITDLRRSGKSPHEPTVFNQAEIDRLFEVMREPTGPEEPQWSRRIKDAQEKLRSGDIFAVARVVRNLIRRSERDHLSPVEKSMLKQAKQPLVTEVSLALSLEPADAEALIDALPTSADFPRPRAQLLAS